MMGILNKAKIPFRSQERIATRFHFWPYICDFWVPIVGCKGLIIEVMGGLHRRTWGGRVAATRMRKDAIKRNCLTAEGYRYLAFSDIEIRQMPEKVLERILLKIR